MSYGEDRDIDFFFIMVKNASNNVFYSHKKYNNWISSNCNHANEKTKINFDMIQGIKGIIRIYLGSNREKCNQH